MHLINRVRACGALNLLGALVVCMLLPAHAEEVFPTKYPLIKERERYSDIVCAATIVKTYATGNVVQLEGEGRSEWIAEARADRVFKGVLPSQIIDFKYYGWGPHRPGGISPLIADFRSGSRYVLFLRTQDSGLKVEGPFYQMEIEVAPRQVPLDESKVAPELALARELLFAVESAPRTIGRLADQYFSEVEELVGKKSVLLVRPVLNSSDPLVRFQAAWWLSFRKVDATVMNELKRAEQDESLEEWARSGARDRLRDMAEGKWVPKARPLSSRRILPD